MEKFKITKLVKPPDKYRTMKCSLKSILNHNFDINKLIDACFRTNQIVIHTYQILRLWLLDKYHNNKDIPIIVESTIKMAFKALLKDSQGPKPKGDNLNLYNEFKIFHDNEYKNLNYAEKIDGVNLSSILDYMATDMITNIENNIKMHFVK